MPIYGRDGELAGVSMASSVKRAGADRNVLSKLRTLAMQFHLTFTELATREQQARNIRLTLREKEILCWASEGKSDSVIADILGVSHATIRFHMNNIFTKLDANERTLATVKAIRLGLILPASFRTYGK